MSFTDSFPGKTQEQPEVSDEEIKIAGKELGIDELSALELKVLNGLVNKKIPGVLDIPSEQHELLYNICMAGYHISTGLAVEDRHLALRSIFQQFQTREDVIY